MKKLIVSVLLIGLVVGGFFWLSKLRITVGALDGDTTRAVRGDLVVPILAGGKIEPASISKIKGKASGEVVEIPFREGQMVKQGDLIVRLDKEDEQRRLDQAETDEKRALLALERAKLQRRQSEEAGIPASQAKVGQAEARFTIVEYDYNRKKKLSSAYSDTEMIVAESQYKEAQSALAAARADLENAKLGLKTADIEIDSAEQTWENAKKAKDEAQQRLDETSVISPIDGMLLKPSVQIGEVIQSGKTSIMGGTELMQIADVSEIYAMVNVDEADIGLVRELAPPSARPGPTATQPAAAAAEDPEQQHHVDISIESFPDEKFYGVIERISPQSEVVSSIATFKVAIRISGGNRAKLVGLLNTHAEARFTAKSVTNRILVSYDAIRQDPKGEGHGVFVPVMRPGATRREPEFRPCKFGVDDGLRVEVVEGLKEGDEVYTKMPVKTQKQEKEEREREDSES